MNSLARPTVHAVLNRFYRDWGNSRSPVLKFLNPFTDRQIGRTVTVAEVSREMDTTVVMPRKRPSAVLVMSFGHVKSTQETATFIETINSRKRRHAFRVIKA